MKRFSKLIGRLPFAGKMSIKPLVFGLYQSTTKSERRRSYLLFMGILVLFIPLHGLQMKMGMDALNFNSPIWARAISAVYAIANFCVVLTQLHLGYRSTRFFMRGVYPRIKRGYNEHSGVQVAAMLAVTLIGQFIFLSQYSHYK